MPINLTLAHLQTPCLILDEERMVRNITRLRAHLNGLGVPLRPHLKTAKSVEVAKYLVDEQQNSATVSTLKEAEIFAEAGIKNILYAVGIAPHKLVRIAALRAKGADIIVILDNLEQAKAITDFAKIINDRIPVLIEIDCDGHRSGIAPDNAETIIAIGKALTDGGAELRGVLTHAGKSYTSRNKAELEMYAEQERAAVVKAATTLREAGLPCPVVSVGSSPTAHFARNLDGVTEVRAGVFVFFDLVMAGIGVCSVDDIALSVLATVIGHQKDKGWILVDAGWMAMSRDRGTSRQTVDMGYGVVCDAKGKPYADLIMIDANQEHGILAIQPNSNAKLPELEVGDLVRILPNHACASGAQHDHYNVINKQQQVVAKWSRFSGW
ncbi:DSD1 family PLP-dependent enzyme [Mucilaginibacter sp.]|uniref:DSD1 family PLP-dependent enzyme n=1 Tax=Mucilaginibacter sp. TaxID=1882438 RepID=UPI00262243EE|nr:DSD1 family PLP-dependent enzyme [Mucilaginibacter sp.]MDB4924646.1 putative serine dehydratase domain protein [Mucilaginibacter sp.]